MREKMKLAYDITNASLSIATSLNPMGAVGGATAFVSISRELHATAKSLHVNFASWEKTLEDQYELQNGNSFKAIPVEAPALTFAEEFK